jgi:benzoyl-CoA reductase subunit D
MITTCGIDVGASAVKVVLMESDEGTGRERRGARILGKAADRIRRRNPEHVARAVFDSVLSEAGRSIGDLGYVATTGEAEGLDVETGHFYGMTAHARGALFLDPEARAVVDVGALHGRVVEMDARSRVLGYRMTSQCASGTGQFLENIARYLGVTQAEIGPLSLRSTKPEKVSGICAVLAETDVINMVSRKIPVEDILRGIHDSMSGRFAKLLEGLRVHGVVLVTGGLAADAGLLESLRVAVRKGKLGDSVEVRNHPDGVFAGAIGGALWGAYRCERIRAEAAA